MITFSLFPLFLLYGSCFQSNKWYGVSKRAKCTNDAIFHFFSWSCGSITFPSTSSAFWCLLPTTLPILLSQKSLMMPISRSTGSFLIFFLDDSPSSLLLSFHIFGHSLVFLFSFFNLNKYGICLGFDLTPFWPIPSILMASTILYLVITSKSTLFLTYSCISISAIFSTAYQTFPSGIPPAPQAQPKQLWILLFPQCPCLSSFSCLEQWDCHLLGLPSYKYWSQLRVLLYFHPLHPIMQKSYGFYVVISFVLISNIQSFGLRTSDIFSRLLQWIPN